RIKTAETGLSQRLNRWNGCMVDHLVRGQRIFRCETAAAIDMNSKVGVSGRLWTQGLKPEFFNPLCGPLPIHAQRARENGDPAGRSSTLKKQYETNRDAVSFSTEGDIASSC